MLPRDAEIVDHHDVRMVEPSGRTTLPPEADEASLRLRLERKTKQLDAAQPASVAPVAGDR